LPYKNSPTFPWNQRRAVDLIVVQHHNVFGGSSGCEPVQAPVQQSPAIRLLQICAKRNAGRNPRQI
jgi:hypothetical protein